jgi:adenylate kinase
LQTKSTKALISANKSSTSFQTAILVQYQQPFEPLVSDDIINNLVSGRLKQDDCQKHGYVLDGFPKTIEQIQLLENLKIQPTVIVILECPDEVTIERLSYKRIDPITGLEYDINQADLPDEVLKRLQQRPQDQKAALEKR